MSETEKALDDEIKRLKMHIEKTEAAGVQGTNCDGMCEYCTNGLCDSRQEEY